MIKFSVISLNVIKVILIIKKVKAKNMPYCSEIKISPQDKFSDYMN